MENILPAGWEWTTLGKETIAQSGTGFPKYLQGAPAGDFPFVKVSDISKAVKENNSIIESANNYLSTSDAQKIGAKVFPSETVIFAKIGEALRLNRRAICRRPILADNNVMGLIPNIKRIKSKYLFYFMQTIDLSKYSQATTLPSVRKSDIESIPLPLPTLQDQERIVAKIEELFTQLDAGTAALKRAQAGLKRYKASVLKAAVEGRLVPQDPSDEPAEEMLRRLGKKPLDGNNLTELPKGWCWTRIGDITTLNSRDPNIKNLPDDYEISFVPMAAVDSKRGTITTQQARKIIEVRKGFTQFTEGDVIFAKITPCMENGKAAIAKNLLNGFGFGSTEFHVLRPTSILNSDYLFHFVRQENFRRDAKAHFSGTAGQLRVPIKFISDYFFPLPPKRVQEEIVLLLEQAITMEEEIENSIDKQINVTNRLRMAILKQAFEGRL